MDVGRKILKWAHTNVGTLLFIPRLHHGAVSLKDGLYLYRIVEENGWTHPIVPLTAGKRGRHNRDNIVLMAKGPEGVLDSAWK